MDRCPHPGRGAEGSCEDVPSRNDSDAQIATPPSGRSFDDRWFRNHASPGASSDPPPNRAILEFWRPEVQPSAWIDHPRDQKSEIFRLLLLPSLLSLPKFFLHFVVGGAGEGIKENHHDRCEPQPESRQIIRRDEAQQGLVETHIKFSLIKLPQRPAALAHPGMLSQSACLEEQCPRSNRR